MFQNGQSNAPLRILGEFDNCRHECFGENFKTNHLVYAFDIFDYVQSHLGTVVFEKNYGKSWITVIYKKVAIFKSQNFKIQKLNPTISKSIKSQNIKSIKSLNNSIVKKWKFQKKGKFPKIKILLEFFKIIKT